MTVIPDAREVAACPICQAGIAADVIAALEHTWVTAPTVAPLPGYVCVVSRSHVREPYQLPEPQRLGFWRDLDHVAAVVDAALRPSKLNYEIHGNTIPHLHAHLFPRSRNDPFQGRPIDPRETRPRRPGELEQLREALAPLTCPPG